MSSHQHGEPALQLSVAASLAQTDRKDVQRAAKRPLSEEAYMYFEKLFCHSKQKATAQSGEHVRGGGFASATTVSSV
jgi:hypothetical protein